MRVTLTLKCKPTTETMVKTVPRHSVSPLQFLRDAFDADIFAKVAEACTATCDFLYVGFGEPAPFPV